MPKRKTAEDYHALAAERGFRCLRVARTTNVKSLWRCKQGHEWQASYGSIKNGSRCFYCHGKIPKTAEDYHVLAGVHGLTLIKMGSNTRKKSTWRCPEGHDWEASYNYLARRKLRGCPNCAGTKHKKKTATDYHDLAARLSMKCLRAVFPACEKSIWLCPEGHVWEVSFNKISKGVRCRFCFGNPPLTQRDYELLAEKRGLELVEMAKNTNKLSVWKCAFGHLFRAKFTSVREGAGCHHCSQSSGEQAVANCLGAIRVAYQYQKRFRGCRNKAPLPFDFYFSYGRKHFLVEYDGRQHDEPVDHFGGEEGFQRCQRNDAIKDAFAKKMGYILIRIPHTQLPTLQTYLITEIAKATGQTFEDVAFPKKKRPSRQVRPFQHKSQIAIRIPLFEA